MIKLMLNIIFIYLRLFNLIIKLILMSFRYVFMDDFKNDCCKYNNV